MDRARVDERVQQDQGSRRLGKRKEAISPELWETTGGKWQPLPACVLRVRQTEIFIGVPGSSGQGSR